MIVEGNWSAYIAHTQVWHTHLECLESTMLVLDERSVAINPPHDAKSARLHPRWCLVRKKDATSADISFSHSLPILFAFPVLEHSSKSNLCEIPRVVSKLLLSSFRRTSLGQVIPKLASKRTYGNEDSHSGRERERERERDCDDEGSYDTLYEIFSSRIRRLRVEKGNAFIEKSFTANYCVFVAESMAQIYQYEMICGHELL